MRRTGRTLTEAHDLVVSKRPVVYPNFGEMLSNRNAYFIIFFFQMLTHLYDLGFVKQLYAYERVLYPQVRSHFLGHWLKTNFNLGTLSKEQVLVSFLILPRSQVGSIDRGSIGEARLRL